MEVHRLGHYWQFIFHLSGPTHYRIFQLKHPDRVVLDLSNVKTVKRLRYKEIIGTPITDLRYAAHQNNIFRIVFDLAMPVDTKVREISTGNKKEKKLELAFIKKGASVAAFEWPKKISNYTVHRSLFEENTIQPTGLKKKS